jgi:hypothetical protein
MRMLRILEIQIVLRLTRSWDVLQLHDYRGIPFITNMQLPCHYRRTKYTSCAINFFLIGIVGGGVQLGPLGTAATNRPIVPVPGDYDDGEIGGMIGRGNRSTRRKPGPVPLCPPQIPHAARTRTRAAAVGSQRLTAWATARPLVQLNTHLTPWSRGLLEKPTIVQILKNFSTHYGIRRLICLLTIAFDLSLSWVRWIHSIPSDPISLR